MSGMCRLPEVTGPPGDGEGLISPGQPDRGFEVAAINRQNRSFVSGNCTLVVIPKEEQPSSTQPQHVMGPADPCAAPRRAGARECEGHRNRGHVN